MSSSDSTFLLHVGSAELNCRPYVLQLRSEFGTSHSSTAQRTNALLRLTVAGVDGFGEVGLPPKKPACYLADYDDVRRYVEAYAAHVAALPADALTDPFASLPPHYFPALRDGSAGGGAGERTLAALLAALDSCPANEHAYSRAARCGVEMAALDCWSKLRRVPLYRLIAPSLSLSLPLLRKGFYTAAMNASVDTVLAVVQREAGDATPFFKIKVNDDVAFIAALLQRLAEAHPQAQPDVRDWVLDANAAWTPDVALRVADVLQPYRQRVYMVEQPWPVTFTATASAAELSRWLDVRRHYNDQLGVLVFADESMSVADDAARLAPYADGVNVKLEKTGGFRAALAAIEAARALDLKIWCGMMVGSALAASAAGHLIHLVTEGVDLDGALLVTDDSSLFSAGIVWLSRAHTPFGYIGWPAGHDRPGIGVDYKLATLSS